MRKSFLIELGKIVLIAWCIAGLPACGEEKLHPHVDLSDPLTFYPHLGPDEISFPAEFRLEFIHEYHVGTGYVYRIYQVEVDAEDEFREFHHNAYEGLMTVEIGEEFFSAAVYDGVYSVKTPFGQQVKVNASTSGVFVMIGHVLLGR